MHCSNYLILFYFHATTIFEVCWKVLAVDIIASDVGPKKGKDLRINSTYVLKGCINPPIIGLRELLGTYTTVYPQHGRNSTRLLNLNREDKDVTRRCPKGTTWTLTQLCRMEGKFGPGYVFNYTTQEMIKYPKARLYWSENYTGSSEDFSRDKQNGTTENSVKSKLDIPTRVYYILGPNRTESLRIRVDQSKINVTIEGTKFNEADVKKFLDNQDGDIWAYGIPLFLGGPPDKKYNIFLASPTCVDEWNSIISNITTRPDLFKDIMIEINFVYGKRNATRPDYFYYYITYARHDGTFPAWYGRVLNGDRVRVDLGKKQRRPGKIPKNTKRMRLSVEYLFKRYKIWSNDSTDAYSNSSIHNFEDHKLQERYSCNLTCLNFLSLEDIQETPVDLENDYVPAGYMKDLVGTHPFALLFSGENYTGVSAKRLYDDGEYCRLLNFENGVQSLETFGKCVRIYQDRTCYGTSISVYPGSENSHAILKLGLSRAVSIRPCDYFAFSKPIFIYARTRYILKNGKPKNRTKTL
ncbi:unnamed protein product [Allacma fusca]|uniref:Uncharacterized protein n=1 Tax=Allacma fusca TaxID=39272 RepID=A0A8J2NR30_9HEXA|nr:unnamed protein product [Allacma fusca]